MSDKYVEIIEEVESWWKAYKEVLRPSKLFDEIDPEEMILRWADYNERDLGNYDIDILVEMSEDLDIFKS